MVRTAEQKAALFAEWWDKNNVAYNKNRKLRYESDSMFRDGVKKSSRDYYSRHQEECLERARKYREAHREEIRERKIKYRKNRAENIEGYREENRDLLNWKARMRYRVETLVMDYECEHLEVNDDRSIFVRIRKRDEKFSQVRLHQYFKSHFLRCLAFVDLSYLQNFVSFSAGETGVHIRKHDQGNSELAKDLKMFFGIYASGMRTQIKKQRKEKGE